METSHTAPVEGKPAPAADYALTDDVVLIPIPDGTARLLDLCGEFFALPESGATLLAATLDRGSDAAVSEVAQQCGADPQQVRRDLHELLADLQRKRIVYRPAEGQRPPRARIRKILATLLLLMFLPMARMPVFSLRRRAWYMLVVARISFAWFRWTATVETWERWWRPRATLSGPEAEEMSRAIDDAVRSAAAKHWLRCECKERALCCWALARRAGLPTKMVVGVQIFPFAGHCWCEACEKIISDDQLNVERYTAVVKYS